MNNNNPLTDSTHSQLQIGMKRLHNLEDEIKKLTDKQTVLKPSVDEFTAITEKLKLLQKERKDKYEFMKSSIAFYEESTGKTFAEKDSLFDQPSGDKENE